MLNPENGTGVFYGSAILALFPLPEVSPTKPLQRKNDREVQQNSVPVPLNLW